MSVKPKAPIKANTKTAATAPIRAAAKSAKTAPTKLPVKAVIKLNSVQPAAKPAKPSIRTAAKLLPAATAHPAAIQSKQSRLIASLRSTTGVTIEEMMALTGWQAHSVRGVISGALRKRLGLNVVTTPTANGQSRTYQIVDQVAA